ncbi:HEAT repeat domain-containing protein [Polyangium aurulentum]|uniref:HEAT repeat domain-containing protein n=1 Tax=Polyangium aurulentum TaxID=2567896 RepID=UPI0010ADB4CE|nr:HEAT repeat domain-containing protein [Polyangium aurulentum]UQA54782.1 HEAT repeat domain-containing protein [Polyangium aurulentum]
MRRPLTSSLGIVALGLWAAPSASAAPLPGNPIVTPAEGGQQALALSASDAGLVARVCAREAGCSPAGGASLEVPADVKPLLARAKVVPVALGGGKRLVRVNAEAPGGGTWVALVAAPLAGKGDAPVMLWSGWTGRAKGEHGEERTSAVIEEPFDKGVRVVVGELRGDVNICGRPALVAARAVDPATMTLTRGASVQNLSAKERGSAMKIAVTPVPADRPPAAGTALLRAQSASSAVGKAIGTLTDGDPETTWSEAKTGEGRGEFVAFSSASEVGIDTLEIVVRPPKAEVPEGASPKTFFLATPDRVFEVTLPEDAWRKAGARYEIKLPSEIATSCVSLVLDTAYAPAGADKTRVTIAEVTARTALDSLSPEALVGALAGGGDRAKAAAAMLSRGGAPAVKAALEGYDKLDDAGKRLAEHVIDTAPCSEQAGFYARILSTAQPQAKKSRRSELDEDPALLHAQDRIRRCGRAAAPALAELVTQGNGNAVKKAAAAELSLLAPAEAVPVLTDALASPDDALRREMRAALAHAAKNDRALPALATELGADKLGARPEGVRIDLLRALGASIGRVEGGKEAFWALAVPEAPFRTRYLLQAPAAELVRAGDAKAEAYLRASLRKDPDWHVRMRAAEVAARAPVMIPALLEAAEDPEPRVRDAAIQALGDAAGKGTVAPAGFVRALAGRLAKDPWTFVRVSSARAMAAIPASPEADAALASSLKDASPEVRARVIDALGAHRAVRYAEPLRKIVDDTAETADVRARAILALASMCDTSSVDAWTKLAYRVAAPDEGDRTLGAAAIAALGDIKPKDLQKRLAPLLGEKAPRNVREMARAALEAQPKCAK